MHGVDCSIMHMHAERPNSQNLSYGIALLGGESTDHDLQGRQAGRRAGMQQSIIMAIFNCIKYIDYIYIYIYSHACSQMAGYIRAWIDAYSAPMPGTI